MSLPKQSIRITDLERLDAPEKIDAKQELLLPVACNQTEKDTFSMPLLAMVTWLLKNHAADKSLGNLDEIGQGIIDAKQDYFDKNSDNTDLNNFTKDGIWKVKITGGADYHTPENANGYFVIAVDTDDNGVIEQQCRNLYQSPGNIYRRQRINNVWTGWSLITQDMAAPTFTDAPTITNPGTNANQLATLGQLWEMFGDIFQTEYHITEGLLVSGTINYVGGNLTLQAGSQYITNDSIKVNTNEILSLSLLPTGTHYVFGQGDGTLKSWTAFEKVVEIPTDTTPGTLYYNVMTDEYTDGTNIFSLAPLGVLTDGAWSDAKTIQFLNLENLQATLDALGVQRKVDQIIGDETQNSLVTSDTNYERTISAGHYTPQPDGTVDLDYGAGVTVQTHSSEIEDDTQTKDVLARMYAQDGDKSAELELKDGKATIATERQAGIPYEIATVKDIDELRQTALTFEGFVSTTDPNGQGFVVRVGNMWINSATMPTVFPVPASSIKIWNGSAWENATEGYTSKDFDAWRNVNDKEGYYWFAGKWMVMSTDLSPDDFTLDSDGKWKIKLDVRLRGYPEVQNPPTTPMGIVNKQFVEEMIGKAGGGGAIGFFGQSQYSETDPDLFSWLKSDGVYQSGDLYASFYQWLLDKREKDSIELYAWLGSGGGSNYVTTKSENPQVGDTVYGYKPVCAIGTITQVTNDTIYIDSTNPDTGEVKTSQGPYTRSVVNDKVGEKKVNIVKNPYYADATANTNPKVFWKAELTDANFSNYNSDYDFIIDPDTQTFRLPLLNGSETMSSRDYVHMPLPASGTDVLVEYNGWFGGDFGITSGGRISFIVLAKNIQTTNQNDSSGTTAVAAYVPVVAGDKVRVSYSNLRDTYFFGLNKAKGAGSLYYYVGDTIKDPEVIDANEVLNELNAVKSEVATKANMGLDNLSNDGKKVLDGQWVAKGLRLGTGVTIESDVTYDLSSYLPNDGAVYEVLASGYCITATGSAKYARLRVRTDIFNTDNIWLGLVVSQVAGSTNQGGGSATVPVGTGRKLIVPSDTAGENFTLTLIGYRRVGTNS